MTATTASINGVTRPRTFEISLNCFEGAGSQMRGSAEASTLGLKPGEWPDWFMLEPMGTFCLREVDAHGSHIYSCGGYWFTIFND